MVMGEVKNGLFIIFCDSRGTKSLLFPYVCFWYRREAAGRCNTPELGASLSSQPFNAGFLQQHKFPSVTDESRRAKGSQNSFSS